MVGSGLAAEVDGPRSQHQWYRREPAGPSSARREGSRSDAAAAALEVGPCPILATFPTQSDKIGLRRSRAPKSDFVRLAVAPPVDSSGIHLIRARAVG
jgi:hypothetical protein